MSDPFSVAGTAVGIISLGIEACKGLIWYIDNVKDAKEKAEHLRRESEHLTDLLEELETSISNIEPGLNVSSSRSGIVACAAALEQITKRLQKSSGSQSRLRACIRDLGERLSYPFRAQDLAYWRDALGHVQQNLQTALSAFQIDQQRKNHEDLHRVISHEASLSRMGYQSILFQGQNHFEDTSRQLATQTRTIQSLVDGSSQNAVAFETSLQLIQHQLAPVTQQATGTSQALYNISSSLERLEQRLSNDSFTPRSINNDLDAYRNVSRDLRTLTSAYRRKQQNRGGACNCPPHSETSTYLRWPFQLSWNRRTAHQPGCPSTALNDSTTTIALRYSVCSFALRRKIDISFGISRVEGGDFSIMPPLTLRNLVSWNSPAFNLIDCIDRDTKPEKFTRDLMRLFQDGEASPHDRLGNGYTLLHTFCRNLQPLTPEVAASLVRVLLRMMPPRLVDVEDDYGNTCLDYVYKVFDNHELVRFLMDSGIRISTASLRTGIVMCTNIKFDEYYVLSSEYSWIHGAILRRSLQDLKDAIVADISYCENNISELYNIATSVGWAEGCQFLFSRGFEMVDTEPVGYSPKLLKIAVHSGDLSTLQFWLDKRESSSKRDLESIGTLEEGLTWIKRLPEFLQISFYGAILKALSRQRIELQELANFHKIQSECQTTDGRILDAHARCVIDLLESADISIPPHIHLDKDPIYTNTGIVRDIRVMQLAYDMGFRDVTAADISCAHNPPSPLMYLVTNDWLPSMRIYQGSLWMKDKGANLQECWPGSSVTALHCMGYIFGRRRHPDDLLDDQVMVSLLPDKHTDKCLCACSPQGCKFISCVVKGLFELQVACGFLESLNWTLGYASQFIDCVFITAGKLENRWLITDVIRGFGFWKLGIKHTCCDIERICSLYYPKPSTSPTPRYPPKELRRIQKEDAFLVDLLEKLVLQFDADYDNFEGDLRAFIEQHLIPRLDDELRKLKRQDIEKYGKGRRELGVVMNVGSEDEDEDEEEEVEAEVETSDEGDWSDRED
ncbi:hypothetical protein P280DRAFT_296468 [Massarina eburnea CBS 473.64]|uniref:Azaphilone pigments biosynthesis cluster protein L N-terminal domain-containing protein n=1 Tax=Massarina eburnea CBS 473.64 TaxID=1395130 RepID=A0A6A6S306_9PLEO|nr:hypothetical protein P280DRAFT_296468 [Massarina eburnea CBS 473.64]